MRAPDVGEVEYIRAAFDNANRVYSKCPPCPGEPGFSKHFSALLRTLDPKSSTGLGEFQAYATIGDALGWDGIRFREVQRVAQLEASVTSRLRDLARGLPSDAWFNDRAAQGSNCTFQEYSHALSLQAEQEVSGPADHIKLFIKDEPHKISKAEIDRWRLISAQSLVDQMVDRCLFYGWVESEIRDHFHTTSKGGWSPLPSGYQRLIEEFPEGASVVVDKSLWDWTMPDWVVVEYMAAKLRQTEDPHYEYIWMVARRMWFVLGPGAKFRMPTGVVWKQDCWGIMKSGFYLTLSMNGAAQMFQHALAWWRMGNRTLPPKIWTMGDDTITRMNPDYIPSYREHLSTTGCIVKLVEKSREFAGYRFEGAGVVDAVVTPLYQDKHQFIMKHVSEDQEQSVALAFSLLYALSKPGWHTLACVRAGVTIGPTQRLWAKGQLKIDLLQMVPDWLKW